MIVFNVQSYIRFLVSKTFTDKSQTEYHFASSRQVIASIFSLIYSGVSIGFFYYCYYYNYF